MMFVVVMLMVTVTMTVMLMVTMTMVLMVTVTMVLMVMLNIRIGHLNFLFSIVSSARATPSDVADAVVASLLGVASALFSVGDTVEDTFMVLTEARVSVQAY